jgi:hypothetical protein
VLGRGGRGGEGLWGLRGVRGSRCRLGCPEGTEGFTAALVGIYMEGALCRCMILDHARAPFHKTILMDIGVFTALDAALGTSG